MLVVVALCLFAWGALGLFGYWQIMRAIEAQGAEAAARMEPVDRAERKIGELAGSVYHLGQSIEAQRLNAEALRVKLDGFIDGPPSLRRPPVGSGEPRAHQDQTRGAREHR